jgi:beta-glucosidase-like glycosyl hydrolase
VQHGGQGVKENKADKTAGLHGVFIPPFGVIEMQLKPWARKNLAKMQYCAPFDSFTSSSTMSLPYRNASLPIADRVTDLIGRMTLEEKQAQMHSLWMILSETGEHTLRYDSFAANETGLTLPQLLGKGLGQVARAQGSHSVDALQGVRAFNRLQKQMVEETRLGIPVMNHEECLVGLMAKGATLFPSALNYGATWNPDLVERAAAAIGREARSVGCHHGLAPVLDVSRDVRWGRTEETLGEDPYLVGVLATRYVRGLQGEKRDLLATLKHFAGHSFSEGARNHAPVHLGWRELNDTFLLPFEMAVRQANAGSVMPAYHDIDNAPCHSSHHLLTQVLREQWGFDGLVVADYVGISLLHQHHNVVTDSVEAIALAFNAGLDIETPGNECARGLGQALERGLISMAKVDEIVGRILHEKFRLGLFENPYVDEAGIALQLPQTRALAREVAEQSIVLLENNGILPLKPASVGSIAVIGPTADDPLALLGGYSFPVHLILSNLNENAAAITPLAALRAVYGESKVRYAPGCVILEKREAGAPVFPGDIDLGLTLERTSPVSQDTSAIADAVAVAAAAQVAIVCVGDLAGLFQTGTVGEGSDADTLVLPGVQQQLLEAVVATGTPTIVVLSGGRPYNLGGQEDKVAALLMSFAAGQEGGSALAGIISGAVSPSGRMVVSVPKNVGAVPYYYNHKLKSAGTPIAFHFGSRYPFGFGRTYTTFEYFNVHVVEGEVPVTGSVQVHCELRNTGTTSGTEVVQLYVRDPLASVVRPVRELKAFTRVTLAPGQAARVHFSLPVDMLCFTAADMRRVVEPGVFELQVGASSADIRLRTQVTVTGDVQEITGAWRMESTARIELRA